MSFHLVLGGKNTEMGAISAMSWQWEALRDDMNPIQWSPPISQLPTGHKTGGGKDGSMISARVSRICHLEQQAEGSSLAFCWFAL